MNRMVLVAGGLVGLVFIVFSYLIVTASPSESEIEALRQPFAPLPVINLQTLSSEEFLNRPIHGGLPIDLESAGLGREDPFAGL